MVIYGKNQGKAKKKPPEGGFKLLAEEASTKPEVRQKKTTDCKSIS
jgi:hypothetical protein